MAGACRQKAEAAWEALDSSQQSLSFPAVLQVCVQSHKPCHMRDPCWVMRHRLGTSAVCLSSVHPSALFLFPVLPPSLVSGQQGTGTVGIWVSYWCISLGKNVISLCTCNSAGNCRMFFIAATIFLQSPSRELSHNYMCSEEVTPT